MNYEYISLVEVVEDTIDITPVKQDIYSIT